MYKYFLILAAVTFICACSPSSPDQSSSNNESSSVSITLKDQDTILASGPFPCDSFTTPDRKMHDVRGFVSDFIFCRMRCDSNWKGTDIDTTNHKFDSKGNYVFYSEKGWEAKFKKTRNDKKQLIKVECHYRDAEDDDYGYVYDYNGKGMLSIYIYDGAYYGDTTTYKYDKYGNCISSCNYGNGEGESWKTTSQYSIVKRDKHGNWTKRRVVEMDDDETKIYSIKTRKLTYIGADSPSDEEDENEEVEEQEDENANEAKSSYEEFQEVKVDDSFAYMAKSARKYDKNVHCEIVADFATKGNQKLIENIFLYINDILGKEKYNTSKDMLSDYVNHYYLELKADWEDGSDTYRKSVQIKFNHITDSYITYNGGEGCYGGGAHGYFLQFGATFRTSDGAKLNWTMFDTENPEFMEFIKEGLKKYFEEGKHLTDEDFKSYLLSIEDVNHLPLPSAGPFLSEYGLEFIYGQYEIAAYVYGSPQVTMPFETAKKFLKEPGFLE